MSRVLARPAPRHRRLVRVSPPPWQAGSEPANPWIERIGRLTLAAALLASVLGTAVLLGVR